MWGVVDRKAGGLADARHIPHYVHRFVISGKLFITFNCTYFMPIQVITCLCHILNKNVNIVTSLFYQYELQLRKDHLKK